MQPVPGRKICGTQTQGSAPAQPWAELFNPGGIAERAAGGAGSRGEKLFGMANEALTATQQRDKTFADYSMDQ